MKERLSASTVKRMSGEREEYVEVCTTASVLGSEEYDGQLHRGWSSVGRAEVRQGIHIGDGSLLQV